MATYKMRVEFEVEVSDEEDFKAEARRIPTAVAEANGPVTISGAPDLTSPDVATHEYGESSLAMLQLSLSATRSLTR
jgi:hypothetical protein